MSKANMTLKTIMGIIILLILFFLMRHWVAKVVGIAP